MKSLKTIFLLLIAVGIIFLTACSSNENIIKMNAGIEARYLEQIKAEIQETVGDFEPYGSLYIERKPLISFVVAIAHPNERTELLKQRISKRFLWMKSIIM